MTYKKMLLYALCTTLFTGCEKIGYIANADKGPIETRFCLIDRSKSVISNVEKYTADFQSLTDCMQPGTRIVVDFITENPLSDASYPINEFIPSFNSMMDNRLRFNAQFRKTKQGLKQKFSDLSSSPTTGKTTPIIDSLVLAENVFKHYPGTQKRLIIFSDMVEDSMRAKFDKKIPTVEEVIKAFQADRPLPNLSGAQVIIVGVNAETSHAYYQIEQFWSAFFKKLGANVTDYSAALIGCPR